MMQNRKLLSFSLDLGGRYLFADKRLSFLAKNALRGPGRPFFKQDSRVSLLKINPCDARGLTGDVELSFYCKANFSKVLRIS